MSNASSKPPMNPAVKAAWIAFLGTIIGAIIAGIFSLIVAGKKANESSDRPTNVISNLQAGLVLINPSRPASDSFQLAGKPIDRPVIVTATPVPQPVAKSPEQVPTEEIKAGTCSGLDKSVWSVQLAPITPLKSKDDKGNPLTGYNVNLRLANIGSRALDVNYNQGEMTDAEGNLFKLSASSLTPNNPNFPPTEVSAGADLPVNLKFLGAESGGKSVSFSVNLHSFTKSGDLPRLEKVETLSCVNESVP